MQLALKLNPANMRRCSAVAVIYDQSRINILCEWSLTIFICSSSATFKYDHSSAGNTLAADGMHHSSQFPNMFITSCTILKFHIHEITKAGHLLVLGSMFSSDQDHMDIHDKNPYNAEIVRYWKKCTIKFHVTTQLLQHLVVILTVKWKCIATYQKQTYSLELHAHIHMHSLSILSNGDFMK